MVNIIIIESGLTCFFLSPFSQSAKGNTFNKFGAGTMIFVFQLVASST
jgi:hypothetical protein